MNSRYGKRKRTNSYSKKNYNKKQKNTKWTDKKREALSGDYVNQKTLIVADKQLIHLRYIDNDTPQMIIPAAAAFSQINEYNLNGLFDVNQAIGSSATPGFAEWGVFYKYYRVRCASVEVEVLPNTSTANCILLIHAQPANVSPPVFTTWSTIKEFMGNPYTKSCSVGPLGSGQAKKLKMFIPVERMYGDALNYATDDSYRGVFNVSNPIAMAKLYVVLLTMNGAASIATTTFATIDLKINFWAECFGREDLTT